MRLRFGVIAAVATVLALMQAIAAPEPADATHPGENGKITFSMWNGNDFDLHTINADGSGLAPLITGPEWETGSAWSADGERIAFTRSIAADDLYVANADGSGQRPLGEGGNPSWSPDGDRLVVHRTGTDEGLWIVEVGDGSGTPAPAQRLTDAEDAYPDWSPNGIQIAFCRSEVINDLGDTRSFLWLINANGSGAHRLNVNLVGYRCDGTFAPNGNEFLVRGGNGSQNGIFAVDVSDGSARFITNPDIPGVATLCCPRSAWSPDGDRIAFIGPSAAGDFRLQTASSAGGDVRFVFEHESLRDLAWQPIERVLDEVEFTQGAQEVQSIPALKSDLEEDGEPPVPIVAGKPAAMRVYFAEVDSPVTYVVDSNLTADDITVTLTPGCDEIERRAQKDDCESVDFYFLPPEGDYTAELFVKTPGGQIVEEHTFDLTSARAPKMTLVAVSVCDHEATPHAWECGEEWRVNQLASFLRAIAPTDTVEVRRHPGLILKEFPENPSVLAGSQWFWGVRDQVEALYVADKAAGLLPAGRVIYVGAIRPGLVVPYWGLSGDNSLVINPAAMPQGVDSAQEILAHEVGHVLGAKHTNLELPVSSTRPGCWAKAVEPNPDWPHLDNHLYTVGFDTITGDAKPGTEWFELMAYCGPMWISTETTLKMLTGLDPAGTATASSPSTADAWLASGRIDGATAAFDPLVEMSNVTPEVPGSGPYTLEVRGAGDAVLSSRVFEAIAGEPVLKEGVNPPEAVPYFSLIVPKQAGAQSIVVLEGGEVLGTVALTGSAPSVEFDPQPSDTNAGAQLISWAITDADSTAHTSWLEYSRDGGATWQTVAAALPESGLVVDFGKLGGSEGARLRVLVSDGALTGRATSELFAVAESGPEGSIIGPLNTAFRTTEAVVLQADVHDSEGSVTVTWSSSRDGNLGSGERLPVGGLSVGQHTVTMTARDSDNNEVTDMIVITLSDAPIVEGGTERTWGDSNCSGSADPVDALLALRFDAGQSTETGECPALGATVEVGAESYAWGDVDCSGVVDPVDGLKLLRHDSGLSVSQEPGCPQVGTSVVVAPSALLFAAPRSSRYSSSEIPKRVVWSVGFPTSEPATISLTKRP